MALYQDLIMDQIKGIGEPRETKQTSTTVAEPQNEGMDPMSLMMMLMMMNMFKQPQAGLASTLGPEMAPAARLMGGMPGQAPGTLESTPFSQPQGGGDMLGMLLMALLGGGGSTMPGGGQLQGSPF